MTMREYEVDYGDNHEVVENDIPFTRRVEILAETVLREEELRSVFDADEFYSWNSYILPVCVELVNGSGNDLDESEVDMVVEAWIDFTHLIDADHHYPYLDLNDCLTAVAHP